MSKISLTLKSWELGGFGTVMLADFNVKNDNAFAVKDIAVKCTHLAASGTEIDSNRREILQNFPSGKLVKIRKFNMGGIHSQVASSSCRVTTFSFG